MSRSIRFAAQAHVARGFVYLAAVADRFGRRALSWRLPIAMDADFCLEAVEGALARYGRPEIFNTGQGSQLTGAAFTGLPLAACRTRVF